MSTAFWLLHEMVVKLTLLWTVEHLCDSLAICQVAIVQCMQ